MANAYEFDAVVFKGGEEANSSYFVEVPSKIVSDFGKKGQVKVKVTVEGVDYRTSISPYDGRHLLIIRREARDAAGKGHGDSVHVVLAEDTEPRVVDVPEDLTAALAKDTGAGTVFERLSYSHRKEYVDWITSAKKAETRQGRIEKTVQMLNQGTKSPKP